MPVSQLTGNLGQAPNAESIIHILTSERDSELLNPMGLLLALSLSLTLVPRAEEAEAGTVEGLLV